MSAAPDHPFKPDPEGDCLRCEAKRDEHPPAEPELPHLPYAGTSGWSGSETSRERAERDDEDGTTTERQARVLAMLGTILWAERGLTWRELADLRGWHHGQASGVLSVLHKKGRVARLAERRKRCEVYVLPEHVNGRETKAHGRKPKITDAEEHALTCVEADLEAGSLVNPRDVRLVVEALRRLTNG